MKEVYLAYFDFMGFKEFIENNNDQHIEARMNHIFRDIELSLSLGELKDSVHLGSLIPDISNSSLNSLNISDTVLFWTRDCDYGSLRELVKVSHEFNWRENNFNFPVRGYLIKGMINMVAYEQKTSNNGAYSIQCLFGKGLVAAHIKSESQNWAGTIIDESIVNDLEEINGGITFLEEYTVKYHVPFKTANGDVPVEKYAFITHRGIINELSLTNALSSVDTVFSQDNKSTDLPSVQQKIHNTKEFIKAISEFKP